MKLATLKNKSRDGELVVVSRDLSRAVRVAEIAPTLQFALDNWHQVAGKLDTVYQQLNQNQHADAFPFDQIQCAAPLPRAYQWADGSAYLNHVELVRKARGAKMPENFWHDPLMYQGGSDAFLGAQDEIEVENLDWGVDFEAEIAVITDDVAMGASIEDAESAIRLVMLVNDVSLRNLIPAELSKGFGFFQSKPSTAFSPVSVTCDELKPAWKNSKLHLPLLTHLNNQLFGNPNAGEDMNFNFAELIAHAAKTRPLRAGCIIGSGTVSNKDLSRGSSCLAEKRMLEIINTGTATTSFMQYDDRVRIEMFAEDGNSIFGAIDQIVKPYHQQAKNQETENNSTIMEKPC